MSDPINRSGLRDRFWERVPLKNLTPREWEAVCDGCGKCCLVKLDDPLTDATQPAVIWWLKASSSAFRGLMRP